MVKKSQMFIVDQECQNRFREQFLRLILWYVYFIHLFTLSTNTNSNSHLCNHEPPPICETCIQIVSVLGAVLNWKKKLRWNKIYLENGNPVLFAVSLMVFVVLFFTSRSRYCFFCFRQKQHIHPNYSRLAFVWDVVHIALSYSLAS